MYHNNALLNTKLYFYSNHLEKKKTQNNKLYRSAPRVNTFKYDRI